MSTRVGSTTDSTYSTTVGDHRTCGANVISRSRWIYFNSLNRSRTIVGTEGLRISKPIYREGKYVDGGHSLEVCDVNEKFPVCVAAATVEVSRLSGMSTDIAARRRRRNLKQQ